MPKLLQINATANWGSTGRIAEQIGLVAMQHGWESYIAYGRQSNPSASNLIKIGSRFSVLLHALKARLLDRAGLGSRLATKRLVRQIDMIKPDIVQLHNIHGYYINYQILFDYLNASGISVVWTFHDCWALTGHCVHFLTVKCDKWQDECFSCPLLNGYPKSWGFDNSKNNYSLKKESFGSSEKLYLVPVSKWIADTLPHSFLSRKKYEVIHNGVDLSNFSSQSNICSSSYRILAVSNMWTKDKGLDDILKLRCLLTEECVIYVVGLTNKQLKSLPKGIVGINRTQNQHQLVELYASSDVFINPTYADTFPTVNIESLACGTPVITYCTGGSPEAIDKNTGIVIEQGNVQALADAIMKLKESPLSREACRNRAEKYFDKDKCFAKYIDLYERLLEKPVKNQ